MSGYEEQIYCPKLSEHQGRQVPMQKVQQNGVTIDVCDQMHIFLDRGELEGLLQASFRGYGHAAPTQFFTPPPAHHHGRPPRVRNPQQYLNRAFHPGRHHPHGSSSAWSSFSS